MLTVRATRPVGIFLLGAVIWSIVLYASVSLAKVRSSWSGALCGPWGCTAPLEAVVSCHLSWLVVMAAVLWFSNRSQLLGASGWKWITKGLLAFGSIGVVALSLRELAASDWHYETPFLLRRIGLRVIGFVDMPVIPSLIAGSLCWMGVFQRAMRSEGSSPLIVKQPMGTEP